jgi:hypothetical protein
MPIYLMLFDASVSGISSYPIIMPSAFKITILPILWKI